MLGEMDQWIPGPPAVPVSPSGIGWPNCPQPRELATDEVEAIVELAAQGAHRAKLAEFDALEINAHALYLVAQFMSPVYNKRTDKYGQDRLRLLLEIVRRIQEVNGKEFPIIVRYTIATWPYPLDETFTEREDVKEARLTAQRLEEAGVAALHTSYNYVPWVFPEPSSHWPENFSLPMAKALKSAVSIPVLLTGRVRDPELAESILRDGDAGRLVERLGTSTSFWTGPSDTIHMPWERPDEVREAVRYIFQVFGAIGLILTPCSSSKAVFPWENVLAMVDE